MALDRQSETKQMILIIVICNECQNVDDFLFFTLLFAFFTLSVESGDAPH